MSVDWRQSGRKKWNYGGGDRICNRGRFLSREWKTERKLIDAQSGESEEEEVMGEGIGE